MLTGGNEGATARHLAFGRAAQNGVLALLATEQGLTGPKYAFEDARGFCLTMCAEPRWSYLQEWDANHLPEVAFKPYPCARQLHAGVEALLTLMQRRGIGAETIAAIELSVPTHNAGMVNRPATPALRAATLGSGQYVMAVTAWRGKIDLESFEERYLRSEDVRALMARVSVRGSADLDRYFPKYWSGRVSLKLIDGSEHAAEVIAPKGEPENPMTRQEVEEKFFALAAPILREEKARAVIEAVTGLDTSESLRPILGALAVNQTSR
jgi:2-methylcitrate dehydratase PrpD